MHKSNCSQPRVLALITARGGSQTLPRKNILDFAGKPLIAWTINAALNAKCVSDVVLSSDDDEIIEIAKKYGCDVPFKRPENISTDSASTIDVVLHALTSLAALGWPKYDYVLLLQPTSPLRGAEHIDEAFALMEAKNAFSCVSVCKSPKSPYWMFSISQDMELKPLLSESGLNTRRQDLADIYVLNGAIYFARPDDLTANLSFINEQTIGFVMPIELSADIDTLAEFKMAENYLKEQIVAEA